MVAPAFAGSTEIYRPHRQAACRERPASFRSLLEEGNFVPARAYARVESAERWQATPNFYAFDPRRVALLLIGGDKTGNDRFYIEYVHIADRIYDRHLGDLRQEGLIT